MLLCEDFGDFFKFLDAPQVELQSHPAQVE